MQRSTEWAAALFEGEGSAGVYTYAGKSPRGKLSLAMTDEAPVREFAAIVGAGRIHEQTKPNGKREWRWQAQSKADAAKAAAAILPWLFPRRAKQAEGVLLWASGQYLPEEPIPVPS